MQMNRGFGRAGGPRGIEPERHVVAAGVGWLEYVGLIGNQTGEGSVLSAVSHDDDLFEILLFFQNVRHGGKEILTDDQYFRTAIAQQVAIVIRGEKGVDRNRDGADLHRTPEEEGKLGTVEHKEHHAVLHLDTQRAK